MKKVILIILLVTIFKLDYSNDLQDKALKPKEKSIDVDSFLTPYEEKFNETIEFIKQHEGFRSNVYLDINGYTTIGYGFLTKYVPFKKEITKEQADSIVKIKIQTNIELVKEVYPKLGLFQNLAVAHLVYCKGFGRIKKHSLHSQIKNNKVKKTTWIYFSRYEIERSHYRKTRKFEYDLYNL